ncbi:DNA mismatch endonuclease Vsr [Bradyrhizobium sp. RP6]|nr:DNA mismatch endonuclease Vsr [Bradyrhizobium sp. RP6]
MARIKKVNTKPELLVRKILFAHGFRYRLHRRDLPGNPDIVFSRQKKAVLVHGCFWHRHDCPAGRKLPISKPEYWGPKLRRNRERDARNSAQLERLGWRSLTLWECELSDLGRVTKRLIKFLRTDNVTRAL